MIRLPRELVRALDALRDPGADLASAACAGLAPSFDFEVDGEDDADREARLRAASRVCASCVVLGQCAELVPAAPHRSTTGVWAGLLYDGRRAPRPLARPAPSESTTRATKDATTDADGAADTADDTRESDNDESGEHGMIDDGGDPRATLDASVGPRGAAA